MTARFDDQMARVNEMPALGQAGEVISQEICDRERRIQQEIFTALNGDGPLDREQAVQAWIELYTLDCIKRSISKRHKAAQSSSVRAKPTLDRS